MALLESSTFADFHRMAANEELGLGEDIEDLDESTESSDGQSAYMEQLRIGSRILILPFPHRCSS